MSVAKRNLRWGRSLVAACLTLLFSLASLAPVAATAFADPSADMPCCKTKGKCCCRKRLHAKPNSGIVIGAAGCADCAGGTLGSVSAVDHAVIRLQVLTPVIRAARAVALSVLPKQSRISEHNLRQRPPPQFLLA